MRHLRAIVPMVLVGVAMPLWQAAAQVVAPGGAKAPTPPRIERLMSRQELRSTGVSRLTPAQRAALSRWLARYSSRVAAKEVANTAALLTKNAPPGPPPPPPVAPPMPMTEPPITAPPAPSVPHALLYGDAATGLRIRQLVDDGTAVVLEDGSVWEVSPQDRPTADNWQPGEFVVIHRIAAPTGPYLFRLTNTETESEMVQSAAARFVSREPRGK